jgi:hypothetical protein
MAQIPTSNISLQAIQAEVGYSSSSNISLQAQSQNAANTGHTSTRGGYTSPGGGLTGSPYGMGEFAGYVNVIQTVSNVSNATSGEFVDNVFYSGGFGAGGISWQLVQESSASGSNYVSKFYLERTNSAYFGSVGSTNMSVGILYPLQTTTFTQANWPDSYYIDINTSVSATGLGQETFYEVAGSGEDFTSTGNWDSAVKTLLAPGYQGNSTPSTAFGATALTTGECASYTAIWTSTLNFYYKKSGYPDLLAGTKTVYTEINMVYSGICP